MRTTFLLIAVAAAGAFGAGPASAQVARFVQPVDRAGTPDDHRSQSVDGDGRRPDDDGEPLDRAGRNTHTGVQPVDRGRVERHDGESVGRTAPGLRPWFSPVVNPPPASADAYGPPGNRRPVALSGASFTMRPGAAPN